MKVTITIQESHDHTNRIQFKHITIDLGRERKRFEKEYDTGELYDIIKERHDLTGYELVSAPKKLARHRGASAGVFVFSKSVSINETKTTKSVTKKKKTLNSKKQTTQNILTEE